MKVLLRLLDKVRPSFEDGGKLHLFHPLFEAMEFFLFSPVQTTITAPHVRDPLDLKRFMSMAIISLVPCILAGLYFFGLRFIAIIIVSYAAGLTVEVLFAIVRKEGINEGFFVTGILFPLIMPPAVLIRNFTGYVEGVTFAILLGNIVAPILDEAVFAVCLRRLRSEG